MSPGGKGQIEEVFGDFFHAQIGIGGYGGNIGVGNVTPEAVGAEQERIPALQWNAVDLDFNVGAMAERAGQDRGVGVVAGFFFGDQVTADKSLDGGVIVGDFGHLPAANEIGATVADVADPGVGAKAGDFAGISTVCAGLHQGEDYGRAHTLIGGIARIGGRVDGCVGVGAGFRKGVVGGIVGRARGELREKAFDNHARGSGSALVAADAVGHDEEIAQRDGCAANAVLVLFPDLASVAGLAVADGQGSTGRKFAH